MSKVIVSDVNNMLRRQGIKAEIVKKKDGLYIFGEDVSHIKSNLLVIKKTTELSIEDWQRLVLKMKDQSEDRKNPYFPSCIIS